MTYYNLGLSLMALSILGVGLLLFMSASNLHVHVEGLTPAMMLLASFTMLCFSLGLTLVLAYGGKHE